MALNLSGVIPKRVIVVGAGVAGLTCARALLRAGVGVEVFEASDAVGGRVRSDIVDGFTLDRGFQVLFTAYPAARRELDYAALDLQAFTPGAVIAQGAHRYTLSDPLRDLPAALPSVLSSIVPLADKLRTLRLSTELKATSVNAIMRGPDQTTEAFLYRRGFSRAFVENFVRPFFGAIFLDDTLRTSAKAFQFDWKMLTTGETVVPAGGMGQISYQLARELNDGGHIYLNTGIDSLVRTPAGAVAGGTNRRRRGLRGRCGHRCDPSPRSRPLDRASRLSRRPEQHDVPVLVERGIGA